MHSPLDRLELPLLVRFLERILLAGSFAQEGHRFLVESEDVGAAQTREALAPIDPVRADVNAAPALVDPKVEAFERQIAAREIPSMT